MTVVNHLVERDSELRALNLVLEGSGREGRVVLVSGEAGFGKTSLIKTFLAGLDHRFTVLTAACEPVGIPVAFAPLFELLDRLPPELQGDLRSGAGRPTIYAGMLDLVKNDRVVLVLEDVHWADEATLGLLRYLGRRLDATNSLLIASYRLEELELGHPLRLVIADLGRDADRIELQPLSLEGVARLSAGTELDPEAIHSVTLGNPFFVEEVIRHPQVALPPTVSNVILANVGQLPLVATDALFTVALSREALSIDFLARSFPAAAGHLDVMVRRRLLDVQEGALSCRHELIREALRQAVPPARRPELHRRLLERIEAGEGGRAETTTLAYHSVEAGDPDRAVRYSVDAARDAVRAGAHRQAAYHYSNALRFADDIGQETLDALLLEAAREHSAINDFERASALAARRVDLALDPVTQARARAWRAFFLSRINDLPASRHEAETAVAGLDEKHPCEELALALAVLAWVGMAEGQWEKAVLEGDRAVLVARGVGASHVEVFAATTAGTARATLHDPAGVAQVDRAVALGMEADLHEFAARALNNRGVIELDRGHLEEARVFFDTLIDYTASRELDAWYIAALSTRAWINLFAGRWEDTDADLEIVLNRPTCRQTEVETAVTFATLRMRRGDPGVSEIVDVALATIGETTDHLTRWMGCALAMEAAWVGIIPVAQAAERYRDIQASPGFSQDGSARGVLSYWALRLDLDIPEGAIAGPSGLEGAGAAKEAAETWERMGFPIHAAVTAAMTPEADLHAIFGELEDRGAHGVIRGLRRELQRKGLRRIPRGGRPSTRANPAGLTSRQAEVLGLMAEGLSNAAIAKRLYISEKTAAHHVSAVLSRLSVANRAQAVALAVGNGWADERMAQSG